jgi:hypothetical protein
MNARILLTIIFAMAAIPAAVAAPSQKGAPTELLGVFGSSREQCLAFHRKTDDIHRFSKDYYSWCSGSGCEAKIVSHRPVAQGYVLKFVSPGNPDGWSMRVRRLRSGVYQSRLDDDPQTETLSRCRDEDMIAGIGIDPSFPPGSFNAVNAAFTSFKAEVKSSNAVFSAQYALAVPRYCPELKLQREAAERVIEIGRRGWLQFAQEKKLGLAQGWTYEREADDYIDRGRRHAEMAVEADAAQIKDFCHHVIDAFGLRGRVISELLSP